MSSAFIPQCLGLAMRFNPDRSNVQEFADFTGGTIDHNSNGDGAAIMLPSPKGSNSCEFIHAGDYAMFINGRIKKMYQEEFLGFFLPH